MIGIAPAQEAALVIVMIIGIATASQLLVISEVKIIMPKLETNQGPVLVAHKTPTTIIANIFTVTNGIGYKAAISPSILLGQENTFLTKVNN